MKKFMKVLTAMFVITAIISACRKDDSDDSMPSPTNSNLVNATITGIVTDESNQPVTGVQVMAYGNIVSTDFNGIFVLKGDVDKKRCVIEFSRQGYMKRLHALIPSSAVNYVRIMLQGEPFSQSILTGNGGTVNLGSGGSVVFPANAFVINGTATPYIGEVMVYTNHLSPGNPNFPMLIPGGDLSGVDANGDDVTLYSYGMADVTLKGTSGEDLQLAAGSNVTITFPIASTQSGSAPTTVPLWYLDENGLWKEEGQAVKVGNNYVGIVSHFSWWNCDVGYGQATINGRVVDCEGTPLANVTVTVNGQMTVVTDQNGNYSNWVPVNQALTFQVLPQGVIALPSQLENVVSLALNQVYTVPDLVVPCGAKISGQVVNCLNEPCNGIVYVKLNDNPLSFQFTETGAFNILVNANTDLTIQVTAISGIVSQEITSGNVEETLPLGNIQACNWQSSSTSFTINGNGYSLNQIDYLNEYFNQSTYYTNSDKTYMSIEGVTAVGPSTLYFTIPGNHTGTFDLSVQDTTLNNSLLLNNIRYYPVTISENHFIAIIDEYGAVGDSIKGSFSGMMYKYDPLDSVMISNGTFAFLRTPDQ